MSGKPSITEILSNTVIIGAADLIAFAGGFIPVVPAPSSGRIILPIASLVTYALGTFDFSGSPVLTLVYGAAAVPLLSSSISTFVGQGSSQIAIAAPNSSAPIQSDVAAVDNQPINLQLVSGNFAGVGIHAASVSAGGTGYAPGDTGTITTGNGDATYQVLTVSGLGAVLTFEITFPGTGYATGAGQATATGGAQPGVGINFTVDVTAVGQGNGSIKVTTLYQVIDVP
jgi:hypothetical protein